MKHVSESMAGRIAILHLAGFSLREIHKMPFDGPFVPCQKELMKQNKISLSNDSIWQFIFQGSYPRLHTEKINRDAWYSAYTASSFYNSGISRPELYYYRDKDQNEIDLIIQAGRTLYPIEIKMTASPNAQMAKSFKYLPKIAEANGLEVGIGTIICQYPEMMHLKENLIAIPVQYV